MEKKNLPKQKWYERVYETTDLNFSNPELDPYLNVDKYPKWLVLVMAELSRQGLHLSPLKKMDVITPKKVGMNLGQKCANLYAIGNQLKAGITAMENPQNVEKVVKFVNQLEKNTSNPVVASNIHSLGVVGSLIEALAKNAPAFEKIVHNAFKKTLDQPDYGEAVQFFKGFAQGISSPGLLPGKLAQSTDATPIYYKMFIHWQEVDRLRKVTVLYDFLLKRGFTEQTLGGIERLKTICKRIKYAPGKSNSIQKSKIRGHAPRMV